MRERMGRRATGWIAAWAVLPVLIPALSGHALPPAQRVLTDVERFRAATGGLSGEGTLTYAGFSHRAVRLDRAWGEPPRLIISADTTLVCDWRDPELDIVLRLLGAGLSAPDLTEAFPVLGRSLEPDLYTLAFLGDDVVYVWGGAPTGPAARVLIERDTFRPRTFELPTPEGLYRLAFDDYSLADGWFPSHIQITRDERRLLDLTIQSVHTSD